MDKPRCDKHRSALKLPIACNICNRIAVEQRIVRRVVAALFDAGYWLNVDNGGDGEELPGATDKPGTILKALAATDNEYLTVYKLTGITNNPPTLVGQGWVRFVYGNDGWDVISDYATSLSDVIDPIMEYASKLGGN